MVGWNSQNPPILCAIQNIPNANEHYPATTAGSIEYQVRARLRRSLRVIHDKYLEDGWVRLQHRHRRETSYHEKGDHSEDHSTQRNVQVTMYVHAAYDEHGELEASRPHPQALSTH
jgi:hypothetical protein